MISGLRESRVSSSRDVTLGMPFWLFGSGCCLTLLSSFRVASDFQGFLQRFDKCWLSLDKCWFNVQTRPDVKARSSFGAAPSFKKRAIFKLSSRERERERGGPFFRWTDVRASTSALPMRWFLWAEPRPHGSIFRA